jgi:hypothetical protein
MGEIFNKSYADYSSKVEAEKAFSSFKHRWYERLVIAKEISALAFRLLYLLKPYFNLEKGGKAWPSQDTLAEQLCRDGRPVTRECINRLLREVVHHGHLISQRGQHGCAYYMVLKEPPEDELRCDPSVTSEGADQELRCDSSVTSDGILENPDVILASSRCDPAITESSSNNSGSTSCSPEKKKAAAAAGSGDPASTSFRPPPRGRKKKVSVAGNSSAAGYTPGMDADFDEMRRANTVRPYADDIDEDHRAFVRALQFIDRDTLRTKHAAYVKATVEFKGADFVQSIAVWCNGRGWEKSLPSRKTNGGGHRSHNDARRRRSNGADLQKAILERIAERKGARS